MSVKGFLHQPLLTQGNHEKTDGNRRHFHRYLFFLIHTKLDFI